MTILTVGTSRYEQCFSELRASAILQSLELEISSVEIKNVNGV